MCRTQSTVIGLACDKDCIDSNGGALLGTTAIRAVRAGPSFSLQTYAKHRIKIELENGVL